MSHYFQAAEFACHSGEPYPEQWDDRLEALCSQLDIIRNAWGAALRIVSGYRTPSYNTAIAGAKASQHMEGRAADIAPVGARVARGYNVGSLHQLIERLISEGRLSLIGGLGYYPGKWIHVDIRPRPPDGHIARWDGAGIGSEVA